MKILWIFVIENKIVWHFKNIYHFKSTFFLHLFHFAHVTGHGEKLVNFGLSDWICPKSVFPVQSRTNENYLPIKHIRISLSTKFYVNQKICIFGPNLP